MSNESQQRLGDVDEQLLNEALAQLRAGNMSPAWHVLREDEIETVAGNLMTAVIESKCACGQPECNTYRFVVPEKAHPVAHYVIRFLMRGDMMLRIDSDGDVYKLERLYDEGTGPYTIFSRRDDGSWLRTDV